MSKQITVPIEWFEELVKIMNKWKKDNPDYIVDSTGLSFLLGYIQSAEHIIKGSKDERDDTV